MNAETGIDAAAVELLKYLRVMRGTCRDAARDGAFHNRQCQRLQATKIKRLSQFYKLNQLVKGFSLTLSD